MPGWNVLEITDEAWRFGVIWGSGKVGINRQRGSVCHATPEDFHRIARYRFARDEKPSPIHLMLQLTTKHCLQETEIHENTRYMKLCLSTLPDLGHLALRATEFSLSVKFLKISFDPILHHHCCHSIFVRPKKPALLQNVQENIRIRINLNSE